MLCKRIGGFGANISQLQICVNLAKRQRLIFFIFLANFFRNEDAAVTSQNDLYGPMNSIGWYIIFACRTVHANFVQIHYLSCISLVLDYIVHFLCAQMLYRITVQSFLMLLSPT